MITKACTNCGACLHECPTGSIIAGREKHVIDSDTCADHASCVSVCPVDAIKKKAAAAPTAHPAHPTPASGKGKTKP